MHDTRTNAAPVVNPKESLARGEFVVVRMHAVSILLAASRGWQQYVVWRSSRAEIMEFEVSKPRHLTNEI